MPPERISLTEKFAALRGHWQPRIVADLNDHQVKVVRFQGEFLWHHHEHEDELFLVHRGRFRMEFRDRAVELREGDLIVVPRGVEHRPVADEEVEVVLIEPGSTLNTGNVRNDRTIEAPPRL